MAEAVLLDVVAQAELERLVDLGVGSGAGRSAPSGRRRPRGRPGAGARPAWSTSASMRRAAGRWRVSRRRAAREPSGSIVATSSSSRELGGAGDHRAVVVDDHRVAVEDELVLAADEVAERDRGEGVAGPLREHALALAALARVVGRGREVDDHAWRRPAPRRTAAARAPRCPRRSSGRSTAPSSSISAAAVARLEVALLVEDAVVGQVDLAVDAADLAVGEHGGGVVDVLGPLGEADEGDDVRRSRPRAARAAARASARKCSLSSRSSGG